VMDIKILKKEIIKYATNIKEFFFSF